MFNMNRKGVSEVVGMVVFVLLVIGAVSLLIPAVYNLANETEAQLSPVVSCLEIQRQGAPELTKAEYNLETGDFEVTVKRAAIDDYSLSLGFVLEGQESSTRFECGAHCGGECNLPNPGQEKTFFFAVNQNDLPQSVTLFVNEAGCVVDSIEL